MEDEPVIEFCDNWTYGGKLCKCLTCGEINRCTPQFDFFCVNDGDPLQCEDCWKEFLSLHNQKYIILPTNNEGLN